MRYYVNIKLSEDFSEPYNHTIGVREINIYLTFVNWLRQLESTFTKFGIATDIGEPLSIRQIVGVSPVLIKRARYDSTEWRCVHRRRGANGLRSHWQNVVPWALRPALAARHSHLQQEDAHWWLLLQREFHVRLVYLTFTFACVR